MPRVVPEYKNEAKARIINAATQVFATKGFHQATMDDVAGVLGVSKGALYQYFKNKDELFAHMCNASSKALEESLNSAFAGDDLFKTAKLYFDNEMVGLDTQRLLWLEALVESSRNDAIKKILDETHTRYFEIIVRFVDKLRGEGKIVRRADPASVAHTLMVLHDGIMVGMLGGLDRSSARSIWNETTGRLIQEIVTAPTH